MARAAVITQFAGAPEVVARLASIAERLTHAQPFWRTIGEEISAQADARFETNIGPDGAVWPPSWRVKAGLGSRTLWDSGDLKKSVTMNAYDDGVEVGSNSKYARVHQFGATITAKNGKSLRFPGYGRGQNKAKDIFVKSVTIPARPFLGIDDDGNASILAKAEFYVLNEGISA